MAEQLLKDLCDSSKTPKVPKIIRQRASGCLRHYPSTWDLDRASTAAPDVFQPQMEPVYRMIKQYEETKNESK